MNNIKWPSFTKYVKIHIRCMRILTFKIRWMRMQIVAFILYVENRNVVYWFRSIKWLLQYVIS